MNILYITFVDFEKGESGSSVRPQRMYDAFLKCGQNVKLLKGQQNRRKSRKENVKEILDWLSGHTPDICYVESPTGPFFNQIDHRLLKKIKKMQVPIGFFYRDAYWRFGLVKKGKGLVPFFKALVIIAMQRRDFRILKRRCDVIYTPSKTLSDALGLSGDVLPPGCRSDNPTDVSPGKIMRAIFVGGTDVRYGCFKMLDAFSDINRNGTTIALTLICKAENWGNVPLAYKKLQEQDWLQVLHIQGDDLQDAYKNADFALCLSEKNRYNDFAQPVKLYEYMSYAKPVVATNCTEMKQTIEEAGVGIIVEDTVEAIKKGIMEMTNNSAKREEMKQNCLIAREKHSWENRAKRVICDLKKRR